MAKSKKRKQDSFAYTDDDLRPSDEALIASRRQEMEEYILPNHQTILQLSNGNTVVIKSKEVDTVWAE